MSLMQTPTGSGPRLRLALFALAAAALLCLQQPTELQASFDFRASFVADKVVRLWFHKQDGVQVWGILEKLNTHHTQQLWQRVEAHPYVREVKEDLHGPRMLLLYYGLRQTFRDHLRYN